MVWFCISLVIFAVAGLLMEVSGSSEVGFLSQLDGTFMISPWLLLVPVLTGVMIARRWPAMVVLFLASMMAAIVAVIWQPELIRQIADFSGDKKGTVYTNAVAVG